MTKHRCRTSIKFLRSLPELNVGQPNVVLHQQSTNALFPICFVAFRRNCCSPSSSASKSSSFTRSTSRKKRRCSTTSYSSDGNTCPKERWSPKASIILRRPFSKPKRRVTPRTSDNRTWPTSYRIN